mmetsp:Transcript_13554/g.50740  ORF Transcript_13554/g.50740 Transcript_13554/m.50740 type:complete len:316 (-) Transcript_13554:3862-4809(-)
MVNFKPLVFSATTSPQSPTLTSTHETFSRRKSSNAPPMKFATAASTLGTSSQVVPTMLMYTWFHAVPCCPTASSMDPNTSANTLSSSTATCPVCSCATSTATLPLGVRWCPPMVTLTPASSSSFWYTLARRKTRRSRCGSFAPCRDFGTNSSARKTPIAYSLGVTKSTARLRPCDRLAIIPTHSTWKLPRRSTSICAATCGQNPRASTTSLNSPSGSRGDPGVSPRGPKLRRRCGSFCAVGDNASSAPALVSEPRPLTVPSSEAPTLANVKCCGVAPTARSVTATRLVLDETAPARFCPETNAAADSRTSPASRP